MSLVRIRRQIAGLAIFALLLNAFAPAISHALAARLGVTWLEVCTAEGLKQIAVEHDDARPDVPPGAHVVPTVHCPYCAPHGASFVHTPPVLVTAAVAGADTPSPAKAPEGASAFARVRDRARAPPSIA